MLIAHVHFSAPPAQHDAALAVLLDEVSTVRTLPGCHTFLPFPDPTDPGTLGVLHEWENAAALATYLASPGFATVGKVLRPMMTALPVSKRFEAKLLETQAEPLDLSHG